MASVTLTNIEDGQELYAPFEVSGTADAAAGATITAVAWHIDSQDPIDVPVTPAASVSFAFSISTAQCPNAPAWFLLTVIAWDSNGDNVTETRSFQVLPDLEVDSDEENING